MQNVCIFASVNHLKSPEQDGKIGKNKMKNSVYLLNCLSFKSTANFEKNVIKLLPEGVKKITLYSVGMSRVGYGSYNYILDVEINGERKDLKSFTHDSTAYDYYQDLEYQSRNHANWEKQTTLMLLEECQHQIIELVEENEYQ